MLLGLILGPMMEEHLKCALLLGRGDPSLFITSAISAASLGATILIVVITIKAGFRSRRRRMVA